MKLTEEEIESFYSNKPEILEMSLNGEDEDIDGTDDVTEDTEESDDEDEGDMPDDNPASDDKDGEVK